MFNTHWIQINPEEYLFDVSDLQDLSTCHLTIMSNNYGFFLMGIPVFMGYYTVHNMDDPSIGYIPIDSSSKSFLVAGTIPTQFLMPIVHNYWTELGPTIIILALAGLSFYFLVPLYRKWWGDKTW